MKSFNVVFPSVLLEYF